MSPALKYWDATTSSWKLGAVGPPSGQVWQQVIGDGLNTSFTVTHGFGTRSVYVSVYRNSPPYEEVEADVERTDTSSVTVRTYPTVPGVSEFIAVVASAGTAATANITMDPWHTVGAAGEPAFQGSPLWSNLAGGYGPAGFRKYPDGRVRLRGIVKGGTIGSAASGIVFTLPVGYRPPTNTTTELAFATISFDAFGECRIRADGSVVAWAGNNSWFALEDIEFDTESVLQTASVAAQPLDTVHYVGAAGEPAFTNGWSAMSPQAPVFRKDPSGRVFLNGAVKSGTMQQAAFTLPVGYRPARELQMMVSAAASPGLLIIQTTGGVFPWTGSNSNVFLDGAAFDTETVAAYATGSIPACPAAATGLNQGTLVDISGAWKLVPVPAFASIDPASAYTVSGGVVTVTDAGWYQVAVALFNNSSGANGLDVSISTNVTPGDGTIANGSAGTGMAYSRVAASGAVKLGAGAKVYVYGYSPNAAPVNVQVMNFSIVKVG